MCFATLISIVFWLEFLCVASEYIFLYSITAGMVVQSSTRINEQWMQWS